MTIDMRRLAERIWPDLHAIDGRVDWLATQIADCTEAASPGKASEMALVAERLIGERAPEDVRILCTWTRPPEATLTGSGAWDLVSGLPGATCREVEYQSASRFDSLGLGLQAANHVQRTVTATVDGVVLTATRSDTRPIAPESLLSAAPADGVGA